MQFLGKICQNNRVTPQGNPGSATERVAPPPLWLAPLLWDILDPPLNVLNKFIM